MEKDRWVVDEKREGGGTCFEISVLRDSNEHGKRSYGWFGKDKILITTCASHVEKFKERVWNKQLVLAQEVADELNFEESKNMELTEE